MSLVATHGIYIFFAFTFGAVIGSFLNVVVWRMPRGESLIDPPSHCPKCNTKLAWKDNIPVFGWLALRGKCRYCGNPISPRYPLVEAFCGLMFVALYVGIFVLHGGPCPTTRELSLDQDWPLFSLYCVLMSMLLAASLIDYDSYSIPVEMCWWITGAAFIIHAVIALPSTPGSLRVTGPFAALSSGAAIGTIVSIVLLKMKILTQSFAEGGPLLEFEKQEIEAQRSKAQALGQELTDLPIVEFTPAQIRAEMRLEILFLLPALILGGLFMLTALGPLADLWSSLAAVDWLSGLLGSIYGALVGAFILWLFRIIGSYAFGREAMGLGDVHLMLAIGAVLGAMGSVYVFFAAPFFGLLHGVIKLLLRRGREVQYGPYLSMATLIVLLCYCQLDRAYGQKIGEMIAALRGDTSAEQFHE